MKTININPLHPNYSPEIQEGLTQGYIVVTAQRPLNGLKTWENESIGYGMFYAYGTLEQFESVWKFLDAAIVNPVTNEDIENIIKLECEKEGISFEELLQDNSISELAESFNLYYAE
jgi:hypothetical protein